ncbi:MAG TPA: helix-turn-helix domain-containing protein [Solirubrobacteraceae bacterium]|jgi:AcrR family transcriptional regulator|nr:helix-turn-helix domain-containing protein [Solirubrobacteraceae bacterium]
MTEVSVQAGYQQVSIAQIALKAGVSSATFYEQFTDKEDCLIAAYWAAFERLAAPMKLSSGEGGWEQMARAATGSILDSLHENADAARLTLVESRAGGARMRESRAGALEDFERRLEDELLSAGRSGRTLDLPAANLMGGIRNIAVWRLRNHAEDELPLLLDDLVTWMGSYAVPKSRTRWSVSPAARLADTPGLIPPAVAAPARLPRGRHGLPAGVVARSQRTRIIYGTAEVMSTKGFASATVADIVAAAGVSRDVFYEHFSDKLDAFLEAQRFSTQEVLDAGAAAFFSARDWPTRVWLGLQTLLRLMAAYPALSHLRLVECYAAGPSALSRAEEFTKSFSVFLEEGYGYRPESAAMPRVCSQAITGAVFEIIYRRIARGEAAQLPRELPLLTFVAIAPFTGVPSAIRAVEKLTKSWEAENGSGEAAA